ncbi:MULTISPECIES: hypothetical protein [Aliivibrio]|uniref:Uncharacterized protein n=1 Tax=Aliivibrio finisterrensis TaxID=511998 RepID=A0A4Q5L0L7_9GAMM|nr:MULTISPECIES: hypothetical protein [Aliivibrio]MDD9178375.1 hypothetical protein [Aliivibrio sp. A6]MUJ25510.1 hypothetical protein [Aliivibrio fischeri]RYU54940.1 hypothetical protein ERW57_01480 [Aliivibrio finisterrensis]RYU56616.1 hypothetical protein ERW56_01160 [Aliivibrio finisterrensis]RYU61737.1 hypothetical protein ERW50_01160 [Aliivibrio finisterrensis]
MTNFQYYFHELPCFNCKKTKVNTDLGWLTATMKDDVQAQLAAIIEQGNVEADLSVNVTCTKAEARDYLLLNFYGYSEEELEGQIEADDEKEVADEIAELLKDGNEVAVFEHEIALQSCMDCDVE